MQIRLATPADVPQLLEIYRPYVETTTITFEYEVPTLEEFAARFHGVTARFPWYVAEENGCILGYAYADKAFVRAAYQWDADLSVYLRMDERGRGLGKLLYRQLEQDLTAQGYCTVYALVTGENEASVRFHEAQNYRRVATLPATGFKMGRWLDLYWYQKDLMEKPAQPQPPKIFSQL